VAVLVVCGLMGGACRPALRLKADRIADGHLLLGLLSEGKGLAAKVMVDAGIDFDVLRAEIDAQLTAQSPS